MTVLPSPTEQVRYEAGVRPKYALITFAAGLLIVASLLIQEVGAKASVSEQTVQLLLYHKRFPLDIIGAIFDGTGLVLTAVILSWLYKIATARDQSISPFPRYMAMIGAPMIGLFEVVTVIIFSVQAQKFATHGTQGYPEAYGLIHPLNTVLGVCSELLEPLGALLLAAGFIWTALNCMRVGLLPRPMGYAGILAGALVIFAIGPISFVVQGVWLVLAAVLISGRWPNGNPPAWDEGVAIPWLAGGVPDMQTANANRAAMGAPDIVRDVPQQQSGDYVPAGRRKKKKKR